MANQFRISNAAASAEVNALSALLNTGKLRIYSGTQPATVDTALGAAVLLAELTFAATAFGAGSNGVATAGTITGTSSAAASGTAAFFRLFQSDGTTAVCDGTVGLTGCDLNLNAVVIAAGAAVSVTSMTITQGKG